MPPEAATARWLAYAESDLAVARGVDWPGVLTETLCFHAQQAAEKAIKAVLVAAGIEPSRTHDLAVLLAAVPEGTTIGIDRVSVAALTVYAVAGRYPGDDEPVGAEEHAEALATAIEVVMWARRIVAPGPTG
jgi:HEPN domain-containing protein